MVKKILLILLVLIPVLSFSQERPLPINKVVELNKGMNVGPNGSLIDSIYVDASTNTISIYSSGVEYPLVVNDSAFDVLTCNTLIASDSIQVNGIWYTDFSSGGAPEGTAVLSTGETGGTKYLREDGDGTSSWQTPAGGGDVSFDDTSTTIGTVYNESLLEARLDDTISFDTVGAISLLVFESDTISDDASHLTKLQLYSIFDTLETGSSYDSAYVYAYIDYLDSVNTVFYDSVRTALANNNLEHIAMWAAIGNQPPYFLSWEVGNYSDSILVGIASNNFQQDSIPLTTDFSSTEDGTTIGINAITINYDTVFVALDSSITESTNVLLSYTSGYPALQDSSSGITTGWVDKVVTNNTTSGAYEPEYQDVLSAMTTDPTGDTLTWQNDMVKSLIDGGYWDRMDLLYIFATTDNGGNEALLNWIAPTGAQNATAVDVPTWTALEGYAGDATADYINTNYDPSIDATNLVLNSATIAVYNRVEVAGNLYDMGVVSGTDQISFSSEYGSSTYSRINSNTSNTKSSSTSIGFFMTTRTSSTNVEVYRNGVSLGSETNINSTAIPSGQDLIILGRNFGGTPQDFTNNQCSIALVMDGVSDADALAINTIFETYMDNLGKGIQ